MPRPSGNGAYLFLHFAASTQVALRLNVKAVPFPLRNFDACRVVASILAKEQAFLNTRSLVENSAFVTLILLPVGENAFSGVGPIRSLIYLRQVAVARHQSWRSVAAFHALNAALTPVIKRTLSLALHPLRHSHSCRLSRSGESYP